MPEIFDRQGAFDRLIESRNTDEAMELFAHYQMVVLAWVELFYYPPTCWQLVDPVTLDVYDHDNRETLGLESATLVIFE